MAPVSALEARGTPTSIKFRQPYWTLARRLSYDGWSNDSLLEARIRDLSIYQENTCRVGINHAIWLIL